MMQSGFKRAIAAEVCGDRARKHVVEITRFHRGLGSVGYEQAAEYLCNYLSQLGLPVTSVDSPLDNATQVGCYTNPYAWEPHDAIVRMVEPRVQTLVSFAESPTCLRSWSAETGPEGVTAELVHIPGGLSAADYEGQDVRGKIVFVDRGMDWRVHPLAVEQRGALGFISDDIRPIPPVKTRETHRDAVLWFTLSERQLDGQKNRGFGISISPRVGDELREVLRQGPVKVWVKIDARTFSGVMRNPLATIEGAVWPDEEVLLVAHLCHVRPGAIDNAAGCAHITEVAETLSRLIERGVLPRPRRSIRFLYGPEGHCGNVYFQEHKDRLNSVHASLCSHAGGDPEVLRGPLVVMRATAGVDTYINDLSADVLEEVPRYFPTPGLPIRMDEWQGTEPPQYGKTPFAYVSVPRFMGGDSIQNNAWGVPSLEMGRYPNIFWHTPWDTPEKTSPDEFAKLSWAYAVLAYTIADADRMTVIDLMSRVESRASRRLGEVAALARSQIAAGDDPGMMADRIDYLAERDARALKSASRLASHEEPTVRSRLGTFGDKLASRLVERSKVERQQIASMAEEAGISLTDRAQGGDTRVPVRLGQGLVHMKDIVARIGDRFEQDSLALLGYLYEVVNLADGQRTVDDIARVLGHELEFHDAATVGRMVTELASIDVLRIEGQ